MSLYDLPVPARPEQFTPEGAPPGVRVNFEAYGDWVAGRPIIFPRLIVVHTNGASVESSTDAQIRWGNSAPERTKPHYLVGDKPVKVVPSNRRAIANATGDDLEQETGERDVSFWSLSIETADMGGNAALREGRRWPTDCGPFLTRPGNQADDAEIVARILAYESIVHGFPLEVPAEWNGSGAVTHTWPFPYPHYTLVRGKTCPGETKVAQFRDEIIPRARKIRAVWLNEPVEGDTMPIYLVRSPEKYRGRGAFFVHGANVRYALSEDVQWCRDNNIKSVTPPVEQYELLFKSVFGRLPEVAK
jgi:hypothetical protein